MKNKMMTTALVFLALGSSTNAFAQMTTQKLKQIDSNSAEMLILDKESGQAASYVDASSNQEFIDLMLTDKASLISRLQVQVEKEAGCDPKDAKDYSCGEFSIRGAAMNGFARGGWAGAGATYVYMVGFQWAGTGRMFDATYELVIAESVETTSESGFNGENPAPFKKTLTVVGARNISADKLDLH